MSALTMILMAGMAVGDVPKKATEKKRPDFVGTKWVLQEGRKGEGKLLAASLYFNSRDEVEIYWKARVGRADSVSERDTHKYRIDPVSRLPMIPLQTHGYWRIEGSFRLEEDSLLMELDADPQIRVWNWLNGTIRARFKRVK